MTDAVRNYSITNIVWRRIIVCLMAAMLLLTFAACGSEPVQQAAPTGAGEGAAEEQLRQQLSNGDVTEITIQGTLYLSAPAEVVGSKTITGDGKIVARGSWDEDYLITVASGTELVLAGSVTVDGKSITGGIRVPEGAALQVTEEATVRGAAQAHANVLAEGTVKILGGTLADSQGDNVRVGGTLEQNGGTISGGYNNVSVLAGASFVWNGGSNLNAVNDGVLVAEGADLQVTADSAVLKDAGAQGIHLEGTAVIDGIVIGGCGENQIEVEKTGKLTVNECTLSKSLGHGITNRGTMTMNSGDITGAASCGIVNTGALEVSGGNIRANGNKGILVKNGGSLFIASENVSIADNVIGVSVEENATADISKAKINSNTLNNISCFGELYIHDIMMGGSGSNCIATNYGGHVVAKNMEIISTNGNNGIYNINGSLVELTDCIISGAKTYAIRNLDADLVAANLTISNCSGAISIGDYIFGKAGSVKINGLTVSGSTGSNVVSEAYCGGTIELTNAKLGATGSNNLSIKGGHLILKNATVEGNKDNAQGTVHGILMDEGGKITATDVTISGTKYSAIRNRGGYFEGTNITMTDIGQHCISNASHGTSKAPGVVVIRNLNTSLVRGKNVDNNSKGGLVSIAGGYLCQTADNNVSNYNGTIELYSVKIEGTIPKHTDNLYGVYLGDGVVKAEDVEIGPCYAGAIRIKGGEFKGADLTTKGATFFVWSSGGHLSVDGLTTENVTESNIKIDADDATVSITDGKLCATPSNNIRIFKGTVSLKDTDVPGHSDSATGSVHGVLITGGELKVNNVTIRDTRGSAIRARGAVVSGSGLKIYNIPTSGLSITKEGNKGSTVTLDGLVAENVAAENVLADAGTVTLTNATLGVSGSNNVSIKGAALVMSDSRILGTRIAEDSNIHGIMVSSGSAKLENVYVENMDAAALRVSGGTVTADGLTSKNGTWGTWITSGSLTLNGAQIEAPAEHGICAGGGTMTVNDVTVNNPGLNGIQATGGTLTGKNVTVEGVTGYGMFVDKGAKNITLDGLKINTSGKSAANVNVSVEQADYKGTVTLKNSVLGVTQKNNIALKAAAGNLELNNVQILGTQGDGGNAMYVTAGKVTGEGITISDVWSALRVNGSNAVVDVKNVSASNLRDCGINLSNGSVTVNGAEFLAPANYAMYITGGSVTANDTVMSAPGKEAVYVSGGTVTGSNVTIDQVTTTGIRVGKNAGDITVTGLKINAPGDDGKQSAQATNNLLADDGYAKTITLSGTKDADAVLGVTKSNNVRTYSGTLNLNHVDILGTVKDNAICTTSKGVVTASDLEISNTAATALRFKDSSSFTGTDVQIVNCTTGLNIHGSGTHTVTGLRINGAAGNNILLESGFTGVVTVNGTADKSAYLGVTPGHSIRLYGGTINLNYVEIAGTSVNAIHGILSDKTTINASNLTIRDVMGSGLRIRDNSTFSGTNITLSSITGDAVSHAGGNMEITGLKITSAGGYGIDNSSTVVLKGSNNSISGCGNLAVHNAAGKSVTVEGGTISGNVGNDGTMTMGASVTGEITNSGTLTAAGTTVSGNVTNGNTMTLTNVTVNGAVSNTGVLTVGKVYIRDYLYSTAAVTFTGSETAHTAADPMMLTIPETSIVSGTVLVVFDSESVAAALAETFTVPEEYEEKLETSVYHDGLVEAYKNTLRLYKDTNSYVAQVNGGNRYRTLADALAYAATVSDEKNPATVVLLDNIELGSTVTVPAGANIIITDEGTVRTIYRSTSGSWTATTRGVMIDVMAGATLTLQGTGTDTLIIDGNKNSLAPSDANWTLVDDFGNVNISAGVVLRNNKSTRHGAAIRVESGASLNVTGGKFLNNESIGQAGGAIFVAAGAKDISVANAHFENNTAGYHGGAISAHDGKYTSLTVRNSTFTNNQSGKNSTANAYGGAICTYAAATVEGCTFTGNAATHGGAISGGNGAVIGISGCSFTGNTSTQTGGAVNGAAEATLNITNSTFTGNIATGNGGAVSMAKGTVTGSSFTGNSGAQGGAINSTASSAANLVVTNCTVSGNTAKNGGGINAATGYNITLDGCTVTGNDATNSDPQGDNIRLAGNAGASKVVVKATSQSVVLDLHMQAASYVTVSGSLKEGSQIILNWPIYSGDNRVPVNGTAVKFDSAEIAANCIKYFSLSEQLTQSYHLSLEGDKIVVKEGAAVARVEGVSYLTLDEAFAAAFAVAGADKTVTVEVLGDAVITKTVTIPANANIILTDDGRAHTVSRSADFNTSRGVMFDVINSGASLTFTSTSGSNAECRLIIDGANQAFYSGNCAVAVIRTGASLTVNAGVKICNNYSNGAGGVIRAEGGTLTVNGGVFTGNNVVNNGAGVINVMKGVVAKISNAEFTNNSATANGGVMIVQSGAQATIKNCIFDGNHANGNGGAIDVVTNTKGHTQVEGCTLTNNSASKGGAINLATGMIVTIKDSTFSGNSADAEGNDIRMGGATTKVYLSGKVVAQIHNQNASTVYVEGTLAEGSLVVTNWLVDQAARIPAVAVQFDSAEALEANRTCIRLSSSANRTHHFEVANENTLILAEGGEVARVNGISYTYLPDAIAAAAAASDASNPVIVEILNNAQINATVTIPANANIIITDDGRAHTISRSADFNTSRGVMFDVINSGASLTFTSTSGSNADCRLIIDGANQAFYSGNCAVAVVRGGATLAINSGVKICNNYSGGAGAVIRVENNAGAKLVVNGGVFENNHSEANHGGVINLICTDTQSEIRNAVFTGNTATNGGAIIIQNGVTALIENCTFSNNKAAADGGAIYSSGSVDVNACTFTGNSGKNSGALHVSKTGTANVTGGSFTENKATSGYGGAASAWSGILNVTNATFTGNTATQAGGALLGYLNGSLTATGCTFTNNAATKQGGALAAWECLNTVNNCTFTGNSGTYGGAIHVNDKTTSRLVVNGGTFNGNFTTAGEGGAIYVNAKCPQAEITGAHFEANRAPGSAGGAVFVGPTYGMLISNCTFTGNTASKGGAITIPTGSYLVLSNSVFSGNSAGSEGNDIRLGGATSKIKLSGAVVVQIHNQNSSTVYVEGTLAAGSQVVSDWRTDLGRIPAVAVQFDSEAAAAGSMAYITVGQICTGNGYALQQSGATAVLYQAVTGAADEVLENAPVSPEEIKEPEEIEGTPVEENEETAEGDTAPADVNEETAEDGNVPAEPQE